MANDACPHCGAERRYNERYDCGTWLAGVVGNNEVRAGICWDRQLATVTAERDDLRRRIGEAPVYRMFENMAGEPLLHSDETWRGGTRVRLVRDDQPEETKT